MLNNKDTFKTIKAHPVMLLHFLSRYIFLLIIPSLKSIASFFASGNLAGDSIWYLLFMAIILIISLIKLARCRICVLKNHIKTRQGIFIMKENIIEISRISSVSAYSGILLHAVGAVYVKIDTQSGKRKRADFEIVLLRRDCKYLVSSIC